VAESDAFLSMGRKKRWEVDAVQSGMWKIVPWAGGEESQVRGDRGKSLTPVAEGGEAYIVVVGD